MNATKLENWSELLLDTGKKNNLVNFRDTKNNTVEIIAPDFFTVFQKMEQGSTLEVFDPKLENDDDLSVDPNYFSKKEFIDLYAPKIKKNQILIYNLSGKPLQALKKISKQANSAIEETGVNIAYLALGFIYWTDENDESQPEMRAPLLLAPITIESSSPIYPMHIHLLEDEIIVNPTFSYKIQNEYGIKLPEYDDDLGINNYLDEVTTILSKLKWKVVNESKIGIFSFLKINMYKDLKENSSKIILNNNICSLIGEEQSTIDENACNTEQVNELLELHNVVDADASQTEAIEAAKKGYNFVLQGPPGTGKSQTITNIIAECLFDGKKVLFVSEKLAALNVVYDKLKKARLEEFCLELHSHKANKKLVIEELYRTLKLEKSKVSDRATNEIKAKKEAEEQLNDYATEIHKIQPIINKSLYQLYKEIYECMIDEDIQFPIDEIENKSEEYIEEVIKWLERYSKHTNIIGNDYHNSIWYGYINTDNSYQTKIKVQNTFDSVIKLCETLQTINEKVKDSFNIVSLTIKDALALQNFFKLASESSFIIANTINLATITTLKDDITKLKRVAENILVNKNELDRIYDKDIYDFDGESTYKKLTKQYYRGFSRLFSREYHQIINSLKLCQKDHKKIKYRMAVSTFDALKKYQNNIIMFNNNQDNLQSNLGDEYNSFYTNFDKLMQELDELQNVISQVNSISLLSNDSNDHYLNQKTKFKQLSQEYQELFEQYQQPLAEIVDSFDLNKYNIYETTLDDLIAKFTKCLQNIENLNYWQEFIKFMQKIDEFSLRKYIDFTIKEQIPPEQIALYYKKTFYTQWIFYIVNHSPKLLDMPRVNHDEIITKFKEKDRLTFEINKAQIKAKLSAERPSLDMIAPGSAISVLIRENEKKRKKKSIRQLISELGELILTIKPCFLMSPLSVSTYLNSDIKFDVVIFDEASQIFPQDAIGAIYRAKQLIVVGDTKQMPPSNFFNTSIESDDDDELENISDFESILDLCATLFTQYRLKWHYRSRYEDLISFSNKNFYDNELITFPSTKTSIIDTGVDFEYVNGIFDRTSKTNYKEAERVVDLVYENIKKYPKRSLGVVAFSISQQGLIEKLLNKRRQQEFEYEKFFRNDCPEPFFVKNLETVQGDERDTIIFSIAYAKDQNDRLYLNFGPINHEGGERRLNVAVTRAKINVKLVTSIHSYDIDLSRTKAEGARLLREYLDYAEKGILTLGQNIQENSLNRVDLGFEMEVCSFLRERGYIVDTQVGCSSFKVDLALKRPDSSNYVLAINGDGTTYSSFKNVRDRDRLSQDILEQMGWKFYRIWSIDWFKNSQIEKERLLTEVERALDDDFSTIIIKDETDTENFELPIVDNHFEFPKYQLADVRAIARRNKKSLINTILEIMKIEAPISEEWLLKRIAFMFGGREKVTNVVKNEFNYKMAYCLSYGIIRKDGFLYLKNQDIPMLRIPNENDTPREIKFIDINELALGMYEILKHNITVDKQGLFKLMTNLLGFSRIGDAINDRLELVLAKLYKEEKITIDDEKISLKD